MIKIIFLLAFLITPLLPAQAEETGDLILPPITNVSIVHYDYMEPQQFGLLMKVPNAVSGCYDVSRLEFQTSFIEKNYMDINVKGYKRTPMKVKKTHECTVGTKSVSSLIPLDANNLREQNIRQIRFKRGDIEDAYDVELTETGINLTPRRMASFKPAGQLNHNFTSGGLVALHVPMADKNDDIDQALQNFAYGRALTPSDDGRNIFMDQSGETMEKIGDNGYVILGTISVQRSANTGSGTQMMPVALKVFATMPGTTL